MLKRKLQYFGHLVRKVDSLEKTLMLRDWGQEEKGTTEDETLGWHDRLRDMNWVSSGVGDGHGSLGCCSPWGRKELDMPE